MLSKRCSFIDAVEKVLLERCYRKDVLLDAVGKDVVEKMQPKRCYRLGVFFRCCRKDALFKCYRKVSSERCSQKDAIGKMQSADASLDAVGKASSERCC